MTNTALYDSPIGPITLTFDGEALTGLRFGKTDDDSVNPPPTKVHHWLDLYFSGRQPDFLPPIKLFGTDFQRRVWQALLEIPYGQTIAYGDLARRIGCRSAQAVGRRQESHSYHCSLPPSHRQRWFADGIRLWDREKAILIAIGERPPPHGSGVG